MINAFPVQKIMLRGRTRERDDLVTLLAGAAAGRGGARVYTGDPGIGRSALLRSATQEAAGFVVVTLRSGDAGRGPNAGLRELLCRLSIELPARPGETVFTRSVAVLGALRVVAARQPVLICVDDAHELDRETLDVLGFLIRRLYAERVAVLVTARSVAGHPVFAGVPATRLEPLDPQASRQLVEDVAAGVAAEVAAEVAAIAEGNPRALVDLARSLTPAQLCGAAPPPVTLPVDSDLRLAYRARLAHLPDATRWLLLLAAADRDLDAHELTRAASASGVDIAALEPAEAAGLIAVNGPITFPEPLARTVLYHEAEPATRRAAHRTLAGVLAASAPDLRRHLHLAAAATGADAALAEVLERAAGEPGAGHRPASLVLERAAGLSADPAVADRRLIAAARHAWLAGEPHRARLLLGRVRAAEAEADLLDGEIELRTGASGRARTALLRAAARLTHAHRAAARLMPRDRRLALAALHRAGEAACAAGDHQRYPEIARAALALRQPDEPPALELIFELFAGQAALFQGRHAAALGPLRRVFALATALDDADALTSASGAAILLGHDARAQRLANRAVEVARRTANMAILPQALELAAMAEFALGHHDSATATLLDGLRAAREAGQERSARSKLATLAVLAGIAGDRETCLLRVREAGPSPGRRGVTTEWALAALDLFDGRPAPALARLRPVVGTGRGSIVIRIAAAPHLIEAAARCGDRAAARGGLAMFDPWATSTGSTGWLALAARCRALATDDDHEAAEHFRTALALHVADGADFERARTELLLGERLRRRRPGEARRHLRSALETFDRFEARRFRERVAATLAGIGDTDTRAAADTACELTPQQMQIARMVADGATNKEVAAHLFLSRRTVEYHMRNIFAKLGVRSRVELVKLVS
jgi:DNA-binding CsgD family transcriptional regulator